MNGLLYQKTWRWAVVWALCFCALAIILAIMATRCPGAEPQPARNARHYERDKRVYRLAVLDMTIDPLMRERKQILEWLARDDATTTTLESR